MPGPLIKLQPFDAANIASRFPEPLRKPGGMAIQAILDLVGADDPMGGTYPAQMPASPLITRFITGGQVNKPLREAYTQRFIDSARQMFGGKDLEYAENLAKNYPRTVAHARLGKLDPRTAPPNTAGQTRIGVGEQISGADPGRGRIPLLINPVEAAKDWTSVPLTVSHELGHVAQSLGNKHAPILGSVGQRLAGYELSPLERSARQIAARKTGQKLRPPQPISKMLGEIGNNPLGAVAKNPEAGFRDLVSAPINGEIIRHILESRQLGKQPMPLDELTEQIMDRLGYPR